MDPKRTRNGPKRTRNGPKSSSLGWDGPVCRDGGVVREKETTTQALMGITFLYPSTQISDRKAIAIAEEDDSQRMFLRAPNSRHCEQPTPRGPGSTARVKIISGSLVVIDNLFPQNYRYRYRLEIRTNSFNYHYRYRLGVRSHPFISIDSQLPSGK